MVDKIVFNGQEFAGVEAMPADVRKQYEDVMRLLADSDQHLSTAASSDGTPRKIINVKTSFTTRVVVNGREYHSTSELPGNVRAAYDRAIEGKGLDALTPGQRPGGSLPLRQILLFGFAALLLAYWFLRRH